jgi:hypothetical protein
MRGRLQWGQIVFSKAMTSSFDERHHATVRSVKEYAEGEKRTVAAGILYWDFPPGLLVGLAARPNHENGHFPTKCSTSRLFS